MACPWSLGARLNGTKPESGHGILSVIEVFYLEENSQTQMLRGILIAGFLGTALFVLSAQQPPPAGVFTVAQAEAGRAIYGETCGQCHTATLLGRKGDKDELPPIGSLSPSWQKFIGPRGYVAPLAGKIFLRPLGRQNCGPADRALSGNSR